MDFYTFKFLLPEFFLVSIVLFQLVNNSRLITKGVNNYPIINFEIFSQSIFIIICGFLLILNQEIDISFANSLFISDFSTRYIKIILMFIISLVLFFICKSFNIQKINFFEYFSILFFSIISALLLINVNHLITAYIVIELQALSFYVIASFKRTSSFSTEAGLKYFILGSLASIVFLIGSFFIYLALGTLNFTEISLILYCGFAGEYEALNYCIFLGSFLVIITLFIKTTIAPFHFWSPDVYEGSPLASTLVFSIIPKLSFITFLLRWISLFGEIFTYFKVLFVIIGLFSIFWGAYSALMQKRLKRFIIYSSISQIGFIVVAMSVTTLESYTAIYFYLFIYLLSALLLWGIFVKIYSSNTNNNNVPVFLSDLTCYFKLNNMLTISFVLLFFSFSGIPPLSGFLSKFLILFGLLADNNILISIIIILISIVSSYYYLRIIKLVLLEIKLYSYSKKYLTNIKNVSIVESNIISLLTFSLLFIFFYPSFLILLSNLISLNFGII